mgnify:CR=1 FL=1
MNSSPAHAKTPPCDGTVSSLGSRFRWARGWSPERCVCLRTCNAQFHGHGVSGGGWAVVLADACTTLSSSVNTSRPSGEVAPGVAECGASVGRACESRGRTNALGSSRSGGGLSHLLCSVLWTHRSTFPQPLPGRKGRKRRPSPVAKRDILSQRTGRGGKTRLGEAGHPGGRRAVRWHGPHAARASGRTYVLRHILVVCYAEHRSHYRGNRCPLCRG